MDFDVKINGLKEVTEILKQLPDKIQQGAIRAGLRAGANIIKEEAKKRVRVKGQEPNISTKEAYKKAAAISTSGHERYEKFERILSERAYRQNRELNKKEAGFLNRLWKRTVSRANMEMWLHGATKWDPWLTNKWQKFNRRFPGG